MLATLACDCSDDSSCYGCLAQFEFLFDFVVLLMCLCWKALGSVNISFGIPGQIGTFRRAGQMSEKAAAGTNAV